MHTYKVQVIIENKPELNDPEADIIFKNLVFKENSLIIKVTTAKLLNFLIKAKNQHNAKSSIDKICKDLRLYNPLISHIIISICN